MHHSSTSALPVRLFLSLGVILLAGPGCSPEPAPAPSVALASARPSSETPSLGAVTPPLAREPRYTEGKIAGVRYLEQMTGGARSDERVPMIVALHPMGGDPVDFLELLRRYHRRSRIIVPYGHPSGGLYIWYDSVREDVAAPIVTQEADRIAAALAALVAARPTIGNPLVTGFSQGGIMTFALVITHPEALAAAFPISGLLPSSLYPSSSVTSMPRPLVLPPIAAFHGASDLAVPTQSARTSIAELQRAGYAAELREYAGVEHDITDEELGEILERIGRAADGLAKATPAH